MTDRPTKAVTYQGSGGYDVIKVRERTVRAPGPGEVRINVHASAISPVDIAMRQMGSPDPSQPLTPGMDAAGVIESVGPGVVRVRVGDKVMAGVMPIRPEGGGQAAQIVVPEASVLPIPRGVSLSEASTLPMNGLTALLALELAALKPGQTFGVSGGAGLLASYAIPAAKAQGLKVIADAKPEDADLVRSFGADVIVERGDGFCASVRKAAPEGVDALLDTAVLGQKVFPAIRDGGVYLSVRQVNDAPERGIQMRPVWVNVALQRTDMLEVIRDLVEAGKIKPRVTGEFPPEQAAEAHRLLEAGGQRGRSVIVFEQ
ncbi:NADP-dependent oxidoreductase [uncultured Phenylobacterium sp.]|uniref:quinone oxidoreductase family protein n=1 Tax=uncultured Phenylobacterium sp. TaxID=349273 RepID=UPI0025EC5262|nr:NADP-dependent oxidoreductase [uncultured Phenylobacterium sp.]